MGNRNTYRIGLAQIPMREDDVPANADQIVDAVAWAGSKGCDFLVTPESILTGHHDRPGLHRPILGVAGEIPEGVPLPQP